MSLSSFWGSRILSNKLKLKISVHLGIERSSPVSAEWSHQLRFLEKCSAAALESLQNPRAWKATGAAWSAREVWIESSSRYWLLLAKLFRDIFHKSAGRVDWLHGGSKKIIRYCRSARNLLVGKDFWTPESTCKNWEFHAQTRVSETPKISRAASRFFSRIDQAAQVCQSSCC